MPDRFCFCLCDIFTYLKHIGKIAVVNFSYRPMRSAMSHFVSNLIRNVALDAVNSARTF